jgi:hypothetical protein
VLLSHEDLDVDDAIRRTIQATIAKLLTACPFDVSFILNRVLAFSQEEILKLGIRGFSPSGLNSDELFEVVIGIFVHSQLLDNLKVNRTEFIRFCVAIRSLYNNVPYHNWVHAVDAVQFAYSVICNAKVADLLPPMELFGLLLAAVCHDTDHDGTNNLFQRKAGTINAQLAPNLPPLELHHAAVSINVLNLRYPKVFEDWTPDDIRSVEGFMVDCILATDMEKHKLFIDSFREIRGNFDRTDPKHRLLLAQIILKAADLSNTVRNFETAAESADHLMMEFFNQGDRESELGLAISPMCDRKTAAPTPVGQIGFYRFVAGPLWAELHAFFKELVENEQQYESNLARWTELKESV